MYDEQREKRIREQDLEKQEIYQDQVDVFNRSEEIKIKGIADEEKRAIQKHETLGAELHDYTKQYPIGSPGFELAAKAVRFDKKHSKNMFGGEIRNPYLEELRSMKEDAVGRQKIQMRREIYKRLIDEGVEPTSISDAAIDEEIEEHYAEAEEKRKAKPKTAHMDSYGAVATDIDWK